MKFNYLFKIIIVLLTLQSEIGYANTDSLAVYMIIDTIESLENNPSEQTKYISELDHRLLELYSPLLFPYIKKEYDRAENITSLDIKFNICSLMEAIYYTFDEYDKASTIAYQLLKIANESNDSIHLYNAYSAIAADEEHLGNKYANIDLALKAHQYARVNNSLLAKSYLELAMSFLDIDDFEKTRANIKKGIDIAYNSNDETNLMYGYSIMAEFLFEIESFDEALQYCFKVDSIAQVHHQLIASSDILYNNIYLGKIYSEKNDYEQASSYFEVGKKLATDAGNLAALSEVYESLSTLEERHGNHKKSLFYYKKLSQIEQTVFEKEAIDNLNKLKITNELAKKDLEIEIANKKEAFSRKRSLYISIAAIAAILSFIVLLLFSKSKLKTSKIQEELSEKKNKINQIEIESLESVVQLKNKELANLFLHQYEKAELLTSVINNLDTSNSLLTNELQQKLDSQEDWSNFKLHFDKVHEGFFLKLNSLSEKLTSKDIKYCAYIRMNLSSKEIAIMLGISHRTVEGIRGRVRKKLGLSSDVDLVLFLMNL